MIKGKTKTDFEFEIEEDVLDDWELLEALVDIDNGHIGGAVTALTLLLGDKQLKKLKEHCRNESTGKVSQKSMFEELSDILKSGNEKNS